MDRSFFDRLVWSDDCVRLDDLVFKFEQVASPDWTLGEDCFQFYKSKPLVDQYERFWSQRVLQAESVLELGMWDGGSVAFWNLYLEPHRHVGVDIKARADSDYFERFVRSRDAADRIKTFWGVDQADSARMRSIVEDELSGTLDLVIDDASHVYELTKTSFETLFPLVRPGGLYIIEDWAWGHWPAFQGQDHRWNRDESLTTLIVEVLEVLGSSPRVVAGLTVFQGFAVIERGPEELPDGFELGRHISRRPSPRSLGSRIARSASFRARRLLAN